MKKIRVDLGERGYDIHIGRSIIINSLSPDVQSIRVLIVSDSNVDPLYGDKCQELMSSAGADVFRMVIPAGESSKDLSYLKNVYDRALECGLDRSSVIIALGGGVVGDLAGFAAATYMRGVRYIQIPTSLLAMVDSSVGGKTGVNVPQGKNLIGAFYQPIEVAVGLNMLNTLPDREYISGMAEVVKYGVIWDADLFRSIEVNIDKIIGRDLDFLEILIARCCEIKAEVVSGDEREAGLRAILNFGHTFGHAIEKTSRYSGWLHGEAVSVGMVYAACISVHEKGLAEGDRDRIVTLLAKMGLPVDLKNFGEGFSWQALRKAMSVDKKSFGDIPRFVLAERIGVVECGCVVGEAILEEVCSDLCK